MSNFLSKTEIEGIGFESYGENLLISRDAKFYNPSKIALESNIRIDDFCILSAGKGGIQIASYVHIACFTSLIGKAPIKVGRFSNLSSRVSIYSSSDDYSGETMTNPMIFFRTVTRSSPMVLFLLLTWVNQGVFMCSTAMVR